MIIQSYMEIHRTPMSAFTGMAHINEWETCPQCDGEGEDWCSHTEMLQDCPLCDGRGLVMKVMEAGEIELF